MPGGGAEPGESLEQTARREVLEETGLSLSDLGPVAAYREVEFVMNGVPIVSEEHFFVVTVERLYESRGVVGFA